MNYRYRVLIIIIAIYFIYKQVSTWAQFVPEFGEGADLLQPKFKPADDIGVEVYIYTIYIYINLNDVFFSVSIGPKFQLVDKEGQPITSRFNHKFSSIVGLFDFHIFGESFFFPIPDLFFFLLSNNE